MNRITRQTITARLGVRSQTVVPKAVRQALKLAPGDEVCFIIAGERVELVKAKSVGDNPFACFTEWDGEADTKGYAEL